MKEFVLPKRMIEAPEKRLRPQTVIVDLEEKMLSIVFSNNEAVQIRDIDVTNIVELAMNMASSHQDLESAIIEDVPDTSGEKTQE